MKKSKGFFKDLGTGISTYFSAIGFIFNKGLWWYLLIPIVINIALFFFMIWVMGTASDAVAEWIVGLIGFENPNSDSAQVWDGIIGWTFWIVFKIISILMFAFFGGYIVLAIMAPVFTLLSEKTEEKLTGATYPWDTDQFMRDIWRALLLVARNGLVQTGFVLALLIIGFIPIIGWLVPFAIFFISAYYYGFSFMDYTLERQRMSIRDSVKFVREHKGIAIGNGAAFAGLLMIPYCGVSLAGFAAIISVVAATLALHKKVGLVQPEEVKEQVQQLEARKKAKLEQKNNSGQAGEADQQEKDGEG